MTTPPTKLDPPRFEDTGELLIAGLGSTFDSKTAVGIAELWQKFAPSLGNVPGQRGKLAYGVVQGTGGGSDTFQYLAGVEVTDATSVPVEFACVRLPPRRYAIFTHHGHVSKIRETMHAIMTDWLPNSGRQHVMPPDFFERYDERYDANSGMGGTEIWLPVKS
ncbi:MAG TPA: GyrI-like domain-containing protein [Gemmatimonadaceae bacterium]|jgi:AraC family transcriptional regulator|nr:GyrI-like domain-containing protein [Gemmatimonadaceae bacterium]